MLKSNQKTRRKKSSIYRNEPAGTEAEVRSVIHNKLQQAGWDPADTSQVRREHAFRGPQAASEDASPEELTQEKLYRPDFTLLDRDGRAIAIIEAKKPTIDPYSAKKQALPYAKLQNAPFIFLSNGEQIYFWDYENDDAQKIDGFYSRRDLERIVSLRKDQKPLATVEVPEHYIRQGETRTLRPYQTDAMHALDQAMELGKKRFLMELPTGTGKTDLTALYLKRLFKANRAERVLILVDRDSLAKQMLEAIQDMLGEYGSYWYKAGLVRQEKQITICLLQTMIGHHQEYTSGYFDVVITDECHRSIYGMAAITDLLNVPPWAYRHLPPILNETPLSFITARNSSLILVTR